MFGRELKKDLIREKAEEMIQRDPRAMGYCYKIGDEDSCWVMKTNTIFVDASADEDIEAEGWISVIKLQSIWDMKFYTGVIRGEALQESQFFQKRTQQEEESKYPHKLVKPEDTPVHVFARYGRTFLVESILNEIKEKTGNNGIRKVLNTTNCDGEI